MVLSVNRDRLWDFHSALAQFTEPDRPYTRRAFGPLHKAGREWLSERMQAAGLTVSFDFAGNLIGRCEGTVRPDQVIMTGSHSDTVPDGGRFDGISGVLAGLEVAQTFKEAGYRPRHSFEVVDFLSEEPSDFGVSSVGSRAMAGHLPRTSLEETDSSGATLGHAIDQAGGRSAALGRALRNKGEIKAFVELHIEQGKVLEANDTDIGIVSSIVAIRRIALKFTGQADHAGTTPMDLRQDALVAAARLIEWTQGTARQWSDSGAHGHLVATVGYMDVHPNGANVIPDRVEMLLDLRADKVETMDAFCVELENAGASSVADLGVAFQHRVLTSSSVTMCDAALRDRLRAACDRRGYSFRDMPSGAGHDAVYAGKLAPVAMVFIPCLDGRSHCSAEWTEPAQLERGGNVVLDFVCALDAE